MDEFKAKLAILLSEYPDLPEFTIHVQPRVIISLKGKTEAPPKEVKEPKREVEIPGQPRMSLNRMKELSSQTVIEQ